MKCRSALIPQELDGYRELLRKTFEFWTERTISNEPQGTVGEAGQYLDELWLRRKSKGYYM